MKSSEETRKMIMDTWHDNFRKPMLVSVKSDDSFALFSGEIPDRLDKLNTILGYTPIVHVPMEAERGTHQSRNAKKTRDTHHTK